MEVPDLLLKRIYLSSAESFELSAQIGSGVQGGPAVRFHEGCARVPPWFHEVHMCLFFSWGLNQMEVDDVLGAVQAEAVTQGKAESMHQTARRRQQDW